MGNNRDGNGAPAVGIIKSIDAQILETAYKEFAKGCSFTKEEHALIEKLDDIITGASIIVNKDGSSATISQGGTTYTVDSYPDEKPKSTTKREKGEIPHGVLTLVDENANSHSQILAKAYTLFMKDNELTKQERKIIEKLDKVLGDADIQIGECAGNVSIIQSDGKSYNQKVTPCR